MQRLLPILFAVASCCAWEGDQWGPYLSETWRSQAPNPGAFVEVVAPTTITDAASAEFALPQSEEQVTVVFDGVPATDAVNLQLELYSGGAWQVAYVEHVAIPGSIATSYAARADTVANLCYNAGSASGESCSVTLTVTNHGNALYPVITVDGGYLDLGGTPRRAAGAIVWKSAVVATKARLRFSAGNIESGRYGAWAGPYGAFLPMGSGDPVTLAEDASITLSAAANPLYCVAVGALIPGTDSADLYGQVGTAGGIQAADHRQHMAKSASSSTSYSADAGSFLALIYSQLAGSAAGESMMSNTLLPDPSSAANYSPLIARGGLTDSSAVARVSDGSSYWSGGVDAITDYQLSFNTGTMSTGTVRMRELALYTASQVGDRYGPFRLKSITTASAAANVDITLGGGMRDIIIGVDVEPTNASDLYGRVGTAEGIKTANCGRHVSGNTCTSSTYTANVAASGDRVAYAQSCGSDGGENGLYLFSIPNLSGTYRVCSQRGSYVDSAGNCRDASGVGAYKGDTNTLTTFRVLPSTGTITGTFYHYTIGE